MSYAYHKYKRRVRIQKIRHYLRAVTVAGICFLAGVLWVLLTADYRVSVAIISPEPTKTYSPDPLPSATPSPAPPAYRPGVNKSHDREKIRAYVRGKKWDSKTAEAIVSCESSWDPDIIGPVHADGTVGNKDGSVDCGLFQINQASGVCSPELLDPIKNTDYAYDHKYTPRGWQPWDASFKNGCVNKKLAEI
jgi:hypothetical protein